MYAFGKRFLQSEICKFCLSISVFPWDSNPWCCREPNTLHYQPSYRNFRPQIFNQCTKHSLLAFWVEVSSSCGLCTPTEAIWAAPFGSPISFSQSLAHWSFVFLSQSSPLAPSHPAQQFEMRFTWLHNLSPLSSMQINWPNGQLSAASAYPTSHSNHVPSSTGGNGPRFPWLECWAVT